MNESDENERRLEAFGNDDSDASRGLYGRLALGSAVHSINLDEEESSLPSVDVNNIL